MWFEIMKKNLKKQKTVNLILLFFVILSTLFLASSINNTHLILSGVENYMDLANVSDMGIVFLEDEKEELLSWVESREEVTAYDTDDLYMMEPENFTVIASDGEKEMINNRSMSLGRVGSSLTKALNTEGEDLVLQNGQAAMASINMKENDLKEGDTVKIHIGGETYAYTIVECMDILFGNSMNATDRLLFTSEDYDKMIADTDRSQVVCLYINSTDVEHTRQSMEESNFQTVQTVVYKNMCYLFYVFDMVVAGIFIAIGICLIFIALLILRFSIIFTLEESCQEIGLLKALGMRDFSIRKIYLVKYLAIVTAGAALGFAGSFPAGRLMLGSMGESIPFTDNGSALLLNLLSSIMIVIFVLGMCLLFTKKLKKVSAITAIRGNETGERYGRKKGIALHTKRHMGTIPFLGLNDVLCNLRQYMVLFLTFCISFVLITIPLNTQTTMNSDAMVEKFGLDPKSAIYIEGDSAGNASQQNVTDLRSDLRKIEEQLAEKGYKANLSMAAIFSLVWEKEDHTMKTTLFSLYPVGRSDYLTYDEGEAPLLENEVAVSRPIMERNHLKIGDSIYTTIGGEATEFLITGSYTDYMQMGESVRLNPAIDMDSEIMMGTWHITVDMDTKLSQAEVKDLFEKEFPEYKWLTAQEIVDQNVGTVKDVMHAMQVPLTIMLCLLIMLISVFLLKLIIIREKGQIAMLESIGFKEFHVRLWITFRCVWVVALAMICSVPLSMLSNRFILTPIFGIMGATLTIQVDPLKAYLIYPGILLAAIVVATIFGTGDVKKITPQDMTNVD